MKGNDLIEKILNKEIKSGTLIKMKNHYPGLEWEKTIYFNGNWFSEEKYYPGVSRYDDIILHLCSDYMTFEIIEEKEMCHKCGKYPCEYNQTYCEFCLGISEEDKKIRKIKVNYSPDLEEKIFYEDGDKTNYYVLGDAGTELLINKINEIIDYINGGTNGE